MLLLGNHQLSNRFACFDVGLHVSSGGGVSRSCTSNGSDQPASRRHGEYWEHVVMYCYTDMHASYVIPEAQVEGSPLPPLLHYL